MEYLFSDSAIDKMTDKVQCNKTLFALEFDGALAPIIPDPSAASVAPEIETLLNLLSQEANVVVMSGRKIEDLDKRLANATNAYLIGNHGIENRLKDYAELRALAQKVCAGWKFRLEEFFATSLAVPYVDIEDKTYSLSLHYRRARNLGSCYDEIRRACKMLLPSPRILHGDAVVNLLPPGAPHKGVTICQLLRESELDNAVFVGNYTEEDLFYAPSNKLITIRVGYDPNSSAPFYLRDQREVENLLHLFLGLM